MDEAHSDDPQYAVEYVPDIFRHLHKTETRHHPAPNYMEKQPHVNANMRSILVDWLVDVHKRYRLRSETLFLAVGIIDRFLERRVVARRHLQLVGITALFVAAKFEEMYVPQVKEFVHVTDKAYSEAEVMRMEVSILTVLDFQVCQPTAIHFLDRYQVINGCTEAHRDIAHYLLELTLVEYKMLKYTPSHLAASAVLLSNKLVRRYPCWTPAAVKHTRMAEQTLKDCSKELCTLLEKAETNPLKAVRNKFSKHKYHSVATLKWPGVTAPSSASVPASPASLVPSSQISDDRGRGCTSRVSTSSESGGNGQSSAGEQGPVDCLLPAAFSATRCL
jgi:cyclin B